MFIDNKPLLTTLPEPAAVRERLGDALREVELLRKLLRLAKVAATYREIDRTRKAQASEVSHAE